MKDTSKHQLRDSSGGAAITVRVETYTGRDQIAEILGDGTLRVQIKTTASGEKINAALLDFLARALGVPASRMEIVAGGNGADKLVAILNVDSAALQERILKLVGKPL